MLLRVGVTPGKQLPPEFKAGIERHFGSLNTGLFHGLPGTTFSDPQERGDYASPARACLYLSEVMRALHIFVVDIYAQEYHKGLGIPARRWEAATQTGLLPRLPDSAKELRILLGRVDYRMIHHYGIEFETLRYNTPELGLLRNRLEGEQVKLKYHPGDLSRIYVFNPFAEPGEEKYVEVPACDPESYTQNLSLWKHKVIQRYARRLEDKPDLAALGRAKREIRAIVEAAKGRKGQRGRKRIARYQSVPPSLAQADQAPETATSAFPALPTPAASATPSTPEAERLAANSHTDDPAQDWELTFDLPRNRAAMYASLQRKEVADETTGQP